MGQTQKSKERQVSQILTKTIGMESKGTQD